MSGYFPKNFDCHNNQLITSMQCHRGMCRATPDVNSQLIRAIIMHTYALNTTRCI